MLIHRPSQNSIFYLLATLMVTCYLAANVMAVKVIEIAGISLFDAGTIIFPLTYLMGEVVTEIWGIRKARQLIYLTFCCQLLFVGITWIGLFLPSPDNMTAMADAYDLVFTFTPRVMLASLVAFLVGELTNAHLMSYIKSKHGGPLWTRTIGSSLVGFTLDTCLFVLIAFGCMAEKKQILSMIGIQIAGKLLVEAVFSTPMAYGLIRLIKGQE